VAENKPERIAAVVVTHNRKRLLGECVDSLLRQSRPLDALYIIDNASTDGTGEGLLDKPSMSVEMCYVRMAQNVGGAGGFAEGMSRAAEAGFDWLWLMDDDVVAAPDALDVLVRKAGELRATDEGAFILNSLVLARDQPDGDSLAFPLRELTAGGSPRRGAFHWRLSEVQDKVHDGLYRWICPFNGMFVPALAVEQVGLPRKEFFLYGDETDFQFRAAQTFRLYTVVDSRVYHPRQRPGAFDWRQYYNIRNMFIVNRHFDHHTLRNFKLVLTGLAMGLRHGRWGMKLMLRAIRDGLAGRLGKRDDLVS
jgi:rhamnopyranosyl-N-acetylglucosaminyl-diphospho-decaprenol beta-1,3/1,4-galactofuranosyltransferase